MIVIRLSRIKLIVLGSALVGALSCKPRNPNLSNLASEGAGQLDTRGWICSRDGFLPDVARSSLQIARIFIKPIQSLPLPPLLAGKFEASYTAQTFEIYFGEFFKPTQIGRPGSSSLSFRERKVIAWGESAAAPGSLAYERIGGKGIGFLRIYRDDSHAFLFDPSVARHPMDDWRCARADRIEYVADNANSGSELKAPGEPEPDEYQGRFVITVNSIAATKLIEAFEYTLNNSSSGKEYVLREQQRGDTVWSLLNSDKANIDLGLTLQCIRLNNEQSTIEGPRNRCTWTFNPSAGGFIDHDHKKPLPFDKPEQGMSFRVQSCDIPYLSATNFYSNCLSEYLSHWIFGNVPGFGFAGSGVAIAPLQGWMMHLPPYVLEDSVPNKDKTQSLKPFQYAPITGDDFFFVCQKRSGVTKQSGCHIRLRNWTVRPPNVKKEEPVDVLAKQRDFMRNNINNGLLDGGQFTKAVMLGKEREDAAKLPKVAHYIFVSKGKLTGSMKRGEDAHSLCKKEAADAGLAGTWQAELNRPTDPSTMFIFKEGSFYSVTPPNDPSKLAIINVAKPNSPDSASIFSFLPVYVPTHGDGSPVDPKLNPTVWTGVNVDIRNLGNNCGNWTQASDEVQGRLGNPFVQVSQDPTQAPSFFSSGNANCSEQHSIYCFGILTEDAMLRRAAAPENGEPPAPAQ